MLPHSPHRIGRYELHAEIASGGMGRVYLAQARGPGGFAKLVALKTVHPDLAAEPQFVNMFLDEARIASRIDHRNVCQVFDFGESDGRYFIAMEYLIGESVQRVLRLLSRRETREPEDDRIAVRIVADAAEGLHAAHEVTGEDGQPLDVVHRDVSPQNIFVSYDGGVRVMDFGVARAEGRLHQTEADSLKGKLSYMAPEAMLQSDIDRRADVWGLGVVLWELVTGRRFVRGANQIEVIKAVTQGELQRAIDVRPELDPVLNTIIDGALTRDRDERFQSARELGQALENWLAASGPPLGMPQVAEFMSKNFPTERAAAFELVDAARHSSSGVRPRGSEPGVSARASEPAPSPSPRAPRPSRDDSDSLELQIELTDPEGAFPSVHAPALPPQRSLPIAAGVVMGILATGLGIAITLLVIREPTVIVAMPKTGPASTARSDGPQPSLREPRETGADADEREVSADPRPAGDETSANDTANDTANDIANDTAANDTAADDPANPVTSDGASGRRSRGGARSEPVATTGELRVSTPGGWADVYFEGRRLGRTPLSVTLPVGSGQLELRPYGLPPPAGSTSLRRHVRIGAAPTRVEVSL
ncbi:MAG: serine/threonine-protein kinase [Sandaracinaceae bacterium]